MIDRPFIFFRTRSAFDAAMSKGEIKNESIVFIAEDHVMWTHGVVFGGEGSYLEEYATKDYVQSVFDSIEIPEVFIESTLKSDSDNPVSSKALYKAISAKLGLADIRAMIDEKLNVGSSNLVENKTVALAIERLGRALTQLEENLRQALTAYISEYLVTNTFTKQLILELISIIPQFEVEVVDSLEDVINPQSNIIYLVRDDDDDTLYTLYIYTNEWIRLGSQQSVLNLSDYYTKSEVDEKISLSDQLTNTKLQNYYTKAETNGKVADCYNQVEDKLEDYYYDKSDIDTKLADYYNKESIDNTFEDYYTKNDVDSKLAGYVKKSDVYTPDGGSDEGGSGGGGSSGGGGGNIEDQPKNIILEEYEYEALTQYEENAIYFVLEPQEETSWTFSGTFPITLS